MKRSDEKSMASTPYGEIREVFPVFYCATCHFCKQDFKLEKMFTFTAYGNQCFSCKICCTNTGYVRYRLDKLEWDRQWQDYCQSRPDEP